MKRGRGWGMESGMHTRCDACKDTIDPLLLHER